MPEDPPGDLSATGLHSGQPEVDLLQFKNWNPEAQQKALELLRERELSTWKPFYCPRPDCDGTPHEGWGWAHARADQRPPPWNDDWLTLLLSGGRGSGKTRTGSELTHRTTKITSRIILIAATGPDLRETMVEGESGILATSPPDGRPLWEPSKKKLTWPNGCIGQGFSAEEPDRLRGPESGFVWADEPAHYELIDAVWRNMLLGLRIKGAKGYDPKVVATTTPKPNRWMKEIIVDPLTVVHRVSTYANLANLAEAFKRTVLDRYEGTRLGKQELHGEVLDDVEGALWGWEMFHWHPEVPELVRIVVAVDPAGSANQRSDETGIIVLGIGADKVIYVLADYTGRYSPAGWGEKVCDAAEEFAADAIVAEKNYGGDMVKYVLESVAEKRTVLPPRIKLVNSRRGKQIRAEPIVALYEKGRVRHVGERGALLALEEEQTTWVSGQGDSPNRVDALVHGATELAEKIMPAAIADPNRLLRGRQSPTNRHLRAV